MYFSLPQNHTSVIGDAIKVVRDMQKAKEMRNRYDYIIHDVFTGGAEPIDLFTREFIKGLSDLLKPDGVVAIVRPNTWIFLLPSWAYRNSELRWRPPPSHRRVSHSHSTICLPKMPPVSRIATPQIPRGDRLHQHGHVLQEIPRRIHIPRSYRGRLSWQSRKTRTSQAETRNTRKLLHSRQAVEGRDTQAGPDQS